MKTETIQLITTTSTETDPFGNPIEVETKVDVPGVLIGQPTTDDLTATIQLYGKRISYVLGIPKGDTNDWVDKDVEFWGQRFRQTSNSSSTPNRPAMW